MTDTADGKDHVMGLGTRTKRIAAAGLAAAGLLTGCGDEPPAPADEPSTQSQRVPQAPRYAAVAFEYRAVPTPPGRDEPLADVQALIDATAAHLQLAEITIDTELPALDRHVEPDGQQLHVWYESSGNTPEDTPEDDTPDNVPEDDASIAPSRETQILLGRATAKVIKEFANDWYHQAIDAERLALTPEGERLSQALAEMQDQMRLFRERRRGLPQTNESRDDQLRLNHRFDQAQQAKMRHEQLIEWLDRQSHRDARFAVRSR